MRSDGGTIEQALLDRQIVIEPIAVGKETHAAMAVARLGQDIEPRHIDLAGIGGIQPGDAAQQRRFPRAVRADQRGDGLAFEGEADIVEGPRAGIVEDEPADGDHVGHSAHFLIKLNCLCRDLAKSAPPLIFVIPAKAGIQGDRRGLSMRPWIPAFAGMTTEKPHPSDTGPEGR